MPIVERRAERAIGQIIRNFVLRFLCAKGLCWNVAKLLVSNNFPLKWEFQGLIVDWIRLWIGLEKGELVTSDAQEGALMGWVMFFAELVSGTGCASTESSKVLGTNTG